MSENLVDNTLEISVGVSDVELDKGKRVPSDRRVLVNVATDTGTAFEIGNTFVSAPDPAAMAFNLGVGFIAVNARLASELVHSGRASPYPRVFNRFAGNLGASLIVSATGLAVSSVSKGYESGWDIQFQSDWTRPVVTTPAVILLSFGFANGVRGIARGLKQGRLGQKFLDAAGIWAATFGVLTSVPDSPAVVKGLLLTAGALETLSAFRVRVPVGLPDVAFAAGCLGNAFDAVAKGDLKMACANGIFAAAFLSLGALKSSEGVYQHVKKLLTGARHRSDVNNLEL